MYFTRLFAWWGFRLFVAHSKPCLNAICSCRKIDNWEDGGATAVANQNEYPTSGIRNDYDFRRAETSRPAPATVSSARTDGSGTGTGTGIVPTLPTLVPAFGPTASVPCAANIELLRNSDGGPSTVTENGPIPFPAAEFPMIVDPV
jgi:hypothetical protein